MSTLARSKFVCALLATAAAALAGCHIVRPEGRATEMRLGETKGDLTEVAVVLELRNPGRDEIDLVEYDYTISLADGSRYGGRWAALRALPPGQAVEATLPAVLPTASLAEGMAWSATGTGKYRDPNSVFRILYEAGILKNEYSFSTNGTKKFSKAASTSVVAPVEAPAEAPATTPAVTPAATPAANPSTAPKSQ
jgi:hypothetical protein